MAPDFVRYTPEIETLDPNLDRLMEQLIAFWERKVRESPVVEGSGRAVRGAHAKTYGVVKAEVQILRNVPPAYAQGIYAKPGGHGGLIPFSSASNHLGPDATLGGAKALRQPKLGSLEIDKKADLLVVDTRRAHLTPAARIVSAWIHNGQPGDIESVMIDGQFVMRNRKIITVDEDSILKQADSVGRRVWKRVQETGAIPIPRLPRPE